MIVGRRRGFVIASTRDHPVVPRRSGAGRNTSVAERRSFTGRHSGFRHLVGIDEDGRVPDFGTMAARRSQETFPGMRWHDIRRRALTPFGRLFEISEPGRQGNVARRASLMERREEALISRWIDRLPGAAGDRVAGCHRRSERSVPRRGSWDAWGRVQLENLFRAAAHMGEAAASRRPLAPGLPHSKTSPRNAQTAFRRKRGPRRRSNGRARVRKGQALVFGLPGTRRCEGQPALTANGV